MWAGTRRLLGLNRPSLAKVLRPLLTTDTKLALVVSPYLSPSDWVDDCVEGSLEGLLVARGGPVRRQAAFESLVEEVRRTLPARVADLAERSVEVLVANREVVSRLAELPAAHAVVARDVDAQRNRLVYPGFLTTVDPSRLGDIARYLRGAAYRLGRIAENTPRDTELMVRVRTLEAQWDTLIGTLPWSVELEDAGWMLQELRISLFAQHLRARQTVGATSGRSSNQTVSEKRAGTILDRLAIGVSPGR